MQEIDWLKRVIRESGELSKNGENQEALKLVDTSILQAAHESKAAWVRILRRHAAVICDHAGELDLAKRYNEQVLTDNPDDTVSLYALASIALRQGSAELAKRHAAKCYEICLQRRGKEDEAVIEALLRQWPDLGRQGA